MLGGLAVSTDAARPGPRWLAVAFGLSAVALGACGGSPPIARGYGSTELEPMRDPTLSLSGETSPGVLVYSTGGGASGTPKVWWTIDATTGAVQSYGTTMPPSLGYRRVITPPPSPFTCNQTYLFGDPFTLVIVDNTTNVDSYIPNVITAASCPGADGMLIAFVLDADGGIVLETGPYTQLGPVELTVGVLAVVSWNGATATSPPTSVTVLAAPVTAPDQQELDSIDLDDGYYDVTPVVPAVPASAAWATGATPVGSLQSTTLAGSTSTVQALDGHYIYPRWMSDGGTTSVRRPVRLGRRQRAGAVRDPPGHAPADRRLGSTSVPPASAFRSTISLPGRSTAGFLARGHHHRLGRHRSGAGDLPVGHRASTSRACGRPINRRCCSRCRRARTTTREQRPARSADAGRARRGRELSAARRQTAWSRRPSRPTPISCTGSFNHRPAIRSSGSPAVTEAARG